MPVAEPERSSGSGRSFRNPLVNGADDRGHGSGHGHDKQDRRLAPHGDAGRFDRAEVSCGTKRARNNAGNAASRPRRAGSPITLPKSTPSVVPPTHPT